MEKYTEKGYDYLYQISQVLWENVLREIKSGNLEIQETDDFWGHPVVKDFIKARDEAQAYYEKWVGR